MKSTLKSWNNTNEFAASGKPQLQAENVKRPFTVAGIPAYNEEKTIARTILVAERYVDRVVVCDDGSSDFTAEIASSLGADVVRHETNGGYGSAIQSLFQRARELDADALVTIDGDGQHNPEDIPLLVAPVLEKGIDIVVGSRFLDCEKKSDAPWYRRAGIKAITKLTNANSSHTVSDAQSGLRAYSRKALEGLNIAEDGMAASVEILMNAGKQNFTIAEVPVGCKYEGLETSTHNPISHASSIVLSIIRLVVEERPLVFFGLPSVATLLAGMFFGVWLLQLYAIEHTMATNVALISIALTLVGLLGLFTAITLYSMNRLAQKLAKLK